METIILSVLQMKKLSLREVSVSHPEITQMVSDITGIEAQETGLRTCTFSDLAAYVNLWVSALTLP